MTIKDLIKELSKHDNNKQVEFTTLYHNDTHGECYGLKLELGYIGAEKDKVVLDFDVEKDFKVAF